MRISARGPTHLIPCPSLHSIIHMVCFLAILTATASTPTHAGSPPIRVLLFQHLPSFTLSVPPDYSIVTEPAGLLPADADGWRTFHVQATPRNFRISGLNVEGAELHLAPRTK